MPHPPQAMVEEEMGQLAEEEGPVPGQLLAQEQATAGVPAVAQPELDTLHALGVTGACQQALPRTQHADERCAHAGLVVLAAAAPR